MLVCKPTTYMNNRGLAVRHILDYYSIAIENVLIVCDDFNLPFGTFRFRNQGSDGGHNGLKSIIYHLQTENFNRFRFGIGNEFSDAVNFVLKRFSKEELTQLEELFTTGKQAIHHWIEYGIDMTMNKFNRNFIL